MSVAQDVKQQPNLDRLRELNQTLTFLLDNPMPGMRVWEIGLYTVLKELASFFPTIRCTLDNPTGRRMVGEFDLW